MTGIVELNELHTSMRPEIRNGTYVFCTLDGSYSDYEHLNPPACFQESEGLTLIFPLQAAEEARLAFASKFKQITLTVHSSLDAVGLTAAVAGKLASHGISANVVAAYFHDPVLVPAEKAGEALALLKELSETKGGMK